MNALGTDAGCVPVALAAGAGGWEAVGVGAKSDAGGATVAGLWGGYSVPDAVAHDFAIHRTQTGDLADDHQGQQVIW